MKYTTERPDRLDAASCGRAPVRRAPVKLAPGDAARDRRVAAERRERGPTAANGSLAAKMLASVAFVAGAFGFFVYAIAATSDVELATASVDQAATAPLAAVTRVAERAPALIEVPLGTRSPHLVRLPGPDDRYA